MEKILLNATELEDLTYGISNINKRLDEMEDRLFNEIKPKFIPLKKVLKILDISRVTARLAQYHFALISTHLLEHTL